MKKIQKEKMKSMLNYYEIDMSGTRSEKMTVEQRKMFLDKFNKFYDSEIMKDIIQRITDNIKNSKDLETDDKSEKEYDDDNFDLFSEDMFSNMNDENKQNENDKTKSNKNNNEDFQYIKEVNTFLGWLYGVLMQSRYNVIITPENDVTNIQLIKLKKGGKKK